MQFTITLEEILFQAMVILKTWYRVQERVV